MTNLCEQGFRQRQSNIVAINNQIHAFKQFLQFRQRLIRICLVLEWNHNAIGGFANCANTNFLFTQLAPHIASVTIQRFFQCSFHVHLHDEFHTATQIQTQKHRICPHFRQPFRAIRNLILRNNIAITQRTINRITR